MATFGANLRREREMRGVPLDEIAAATKISIRCLQALEAEEFSKLPGGIFTRSFIRAYARYLGLNEETVMAEFQAVAPPMEDADLSRLTPSMTKPAEVRSRAPLVMVLGAVIILLGGYGIYRYWRYSANPIPGSPASKQLSPAAQQAKEAPPTATTGRQAGQQTGNTRPEAGSEPNQAAGTPAAENLQAVGSDAGLTLQIAATDKVWVAVDADGKNAMQKVLNPNDIQTFKAKNSFDVMTGNAQGIILTLNGETLKPLGQNGEVKKVHLTQKDLKNPGI